MGSNACQDRSFSGKKEFCAQGPDWGFPEDLRRLSSEGFKLDVISVVRRGISIL